MKLKIANNFQKDVYGSYFQPGVVEADKYQLPNRIRSKHIVSFMYQNRFHSRQCIKYIYYKFGLNL